MTGDLFSEVLKISLFASPLMAGLLLLVPLLRKRYRAKWRYAAWLVITLRLAVPMSISLPQAPIRIELPGEMAMVGSGSEVPAGEPGAAGTMNGEAFAGEMSGSETSAGEPETVGAMNIGAPAEDTSGVEMPGVEIPAGSSPASSPSVLTSVLQIAGIIWLTGAAVFLLFHFASYQIFLRKLKKSPQAVLAGQFPAFAAGILPEPIITNAVDAPMLVGLFRHRILLPHANYSSGELAFILRHELIHFRRHDMWYKLALIFANAMHWFNPLVYLTVSQAAKDIEMSCDDEVARELDTEERARYGNTILQALPKRRRLEPMFSTQFGSGKKNIKSRLSNLFDTNLKRRGIAALGAVIIGASMITSLISVGYAAPVPEPAEVKTQATTAAPKPVKQEPAAAAKTPNNPVSPSSHAIVSGEKPVPDLGVRADAVSGTWASASGIEGGTWQEQIDAEIEWLNDIYSSAMGTGGGRRMTGRFTVSETVPPSEAANISRINYLYENSEVLREMNVMEDGRFNVEDGGSFWRSDTPSAEIVRRTPVMVDNENDLELLENYELEQGRMAVWLIDPDGEIVYQSDYLKTSSGGTHRVPGKKGLWSVVCVFENDAQGEVSGEAWIGLNIADELQQSSNTSTSANPRAQNFETGGSTPSTFSITSEGTSVINSGSFSAEAGQELMIEVNNSITGGSVDFFLFSPAGTQVQSITFGDGTDTVTIPVTATGRWAYNCTGFFESGTVMIQGSLRD